MNLRTWIASVALSLLMAASAMASIFADVVVVVDESGSMSTEHAFIGPAMVDLDNSLVGNGLTPNQFGLVGFGGAGPHLAGHVHAAFGTSAAFSAATGGLVLNGGTEDGYSGITTALGFPFRASSARNIILVTDEDRDNIGGGETAMSVLGALNGANALLNVIVNATFQDGMGNMALGISAAGDAFVADGLGGFTVAAGGVAISGSGTTLVDYVDLALATGGAAWDLNQIRAGGLTGQSFASAFTFIKTQEIINTPTVPEQGSFAIWSLLALALTGFGLRRRAAKFRIE